MKIEELAELVSPDGIFHTGQIVAGSKSVQDVRRQLDRWVKRGWVTRLRRGVYRLNKPYAAASAHQFTIANALNRASYVSLQSAMAFHGMIPESTPVTTSVTPARPEELETPVGRFIFRHVAARLFTGFDELEVAPRQFAVVATPEKALFDLLYLTPGSDQQAYLEELRLNLPDSFDVPQLEQLARDLNLRKVSRAVAHLETIMKGRA